MNTATLAAAPPVPITTPLARIRSSTLDHDIESGEDYMRENRPISAYAMANDEGSVYRPAGGSLDGARDIARDLAKSSRYGPGPNETVAQAVLQAGDGQFLVASLGANMGRSPERPPYFTVDGDVFGGYTRFDGIDRATPELRAIVGATQWADFSGGDQAVFRPFDE